MTTRKLVLKMSITLDGFVCGPNGELDWIFPYRSPDGMAWLAETLWDAGVHIMGSRTYQDMVSYWPYSNDPLAAPMNEIPKVIFSRSGPVAPQPAKTTAALKDATRAEPAQGAGSPAVLAGWTGARFATGEITAEVAALKRQEGKNILAHGGARFARSLVSQGLVDEFRLVVNPIALGRGQPLFSELSKPLGMKLVNSTKFTTGTMANVYVPG